MHRMAWAIDGEQLTNYIVHRDLDDYLFRLVHVVTASAKKFIQRIRVQ
ncbi:hypothetical protein [Syntrophotalea acetylenivorans]|nr:hypothetical protein [Syntrophotalea acetylenivorans]